MKHFHVHAFLPTSIFLTTLFGIAACAPVNRTFKAYDGPDLVATETSVLREDTKEIYRTIFLDIDDYTIESPSTGKDLTSVSLRPGFHKIKVRSQSENMMNRWWKDFDLNVLTKPGKSYLVKSPRQDQVLVEEESTGEFITGYYFVNTLIRHGECNKTSCPFDEYESRGQQEAARWFKRSCVSASKCGPWKEHSTTIPGLFAPW